MNGIQNNNFIEKNSINFSMAQLESEYQKRQIEKEKVLEEFEKKGVISVFLARKNGTTFSENRLTSQEASNNQKLLKESYEIIKSSYMYNLKQPTQAKQWLEKLAPYLNNSNLNFKSKIYSASSEIENPLKKVLEDLKSKNYHVLKETVNSKADAEHNRIVNAYEIIKDSSFMNKTISYIEKQLNFVKPYISENIVMPSVENLISFRDNIDKIKEVASMISQEGAVKTILNILAQNGYDRLERTEIEVNFSNDAKEAESYGMTEEQYEHNLVHDMYHEIDEYGFLVDTLKQQLNEQEQLMSIVTNSQEIHEYLEKMEIRTNHATFSENILNEQDIADLTKKKRFAIPAFLERFVSPKKKEPQFFNMEDQIINNNIEDLRTENFDSFAYGLISLKDYINDPTKPLNLENGINVIQAILEKAEELGYKYSKSVEEIINENPKSNPVLVHFCYRQLHDLEEYGCFLTSKCNEIIKNKEIDLSSSKTNQITQEDKQLPAIRVEMDDIFKKILAPGVYQTQEETDTLINMWNIDNNSTPEQIENLNQKVENLPLSSTQKAILESWNNFIIQLNHPKTRLDTYSMNNILNELVQMNNQIIDKNGIEKGKRIVEIREQIDELEHELHISNQKNNRTSLNNGLALMEIITSSKEKENQNFEMFLHNLINQTENEIKNFQNEKANLLNAKNLLYDKVAKNFVDSFIEHNKKRDSLKQKKKNNKQKIEIEDKCISQYIDLRKKFEQIEQLKGNSVTNDNKTSNTNLEIVTNSIKEQETILSTMKKAVDNIQKDNDYNDEEKANINSLYELAKLGIEIEKKNIQISSKKLEISQLQTLNYSNNIHEERINQKIKTLEQEEAILSFNPELIRNEINTMIENFASKEEIENKLSELINPIKENDKTPIDKLENEIQELEIKIQNNENYFDASRQNFDIEIMNSLTEQCKIKEDEIKALEKEQISNKEYEVLKNRRNILENQKNNYEEEKQILLQWSVEETESNQNIRNALKELFEESKENISSIQTAIENCNNQIEKIEQANIISQEEITRKINSIKLEKEKLEQEISKIEESINNKESQKYIAKEKKLFDIEELARKKQQLSNTPSIQVEELKEKFLEEYSKEIEISKRGPLPLPGIIENGQQLKSDGSITEIPTNVSEDLNLEDEIGEIKIPKNTLLAKGKKAFKKFGAEIFEWARKHKLAFAVTAAVVGGSIVIKSLSGDVEPEMDIANAIPEIEASIEESKVELNTQINDIVAAVDKTIEEGSSVIPESMPENNFQNSYETVIENIAQGNANLYTSAADAFNDQYEVRAENLYTPAFENTELGSIYKQEDGKIVKVNLEEAQSIIADGGEVSVLVENEGVGIGFVSVSGNQLQNSNQDTSSISK